LRAPRRGRAKEGGSLPGKREGGRLSVLTSKRREGRREGEREIRTGEEERRRAPPR